MEDLKLNEKQLAISSSDSYDSEFYRDEKDFEKLMELPEVDRERILFSRSERRRKHNKRKQAKKEMFKEYFPSSNKMDFDKNDTKKAKKRKFGYSYYKRKPSYLNREEALVKLQVKIEELYKKKVFFKI